jgi:signal transduction histidine kinase/CheY-like chemotaxis protein
MQPRADITLERVLVLMPSRIDSERTLQLLAEAHVPSASCLELPDVCRELRVGAGAVLITDDALLRDTSGQFAEAMRAEPAWSAVPVLVIAKDGARLQLQRSGMSDALRNMTIVERPVRTRTLLSMVLSALRARRQQYEIRDAILERERQSAALVAQDDKLRFTLFAGGLGSWELDLASNEMICSDLCKSNFGRPPEDAFTFRDLHDSIHPQDRAEVLSAIEHSVDRGSDYDVEYRVCCPNGEVRWVMVRGRVAYDEHGAAARLVGISLDTTDRKRMHEALHESESELARQADQLRNADRLKDDFLATLAHELRNPLAPIRTGTELLATAPSPDIATHTLGVMRRQLGHMVRLIDDLLDVSRITRGKLELKREHVTLSSIIDSAVEASRPFIEQGRHTLRVSVIDGSLSLHADLTRIAQVISNLLNNGSKYTPVGGLISLVARRDGDDAVIEVSDNGIGIPTDRLDDVFTMFSQVNRALDRSQGGLGIGLALVRQFVEMHSGTVNVASLGPGHGSTFTVRLPLAQEVTTPALPCAPNDSALKRESKRILVVDDNDDAADLLSMVLNQAGHLTNTAHDGPSAIAAAEAWSPQIVFLDIGLPGMSGYDVARRLRSDPRFSNTALIALTGWGTQADKRKAVDAGFDVHLTKPVDARTVQGALAELATSRGW